MLEALHPHRARSAQRNSGVTIVLMVTEEQLRIGLTACSVLLPPANGQQLSKCVGCRHGSLQYIGHGAFTPLQRLPKR